MARFDIVMSYLTGRYHGRNAATHKQQTESRLLEASFLDSMDISLGNWAH